MITLEQIQQGIAKEVRRLDDLVEQIAEAGDRAAEAEATYRTLYAKSRLTVRALHADVKLTVDEVADRAQDMTSDSQREHFIAQNLLTTRREALRASQARLDGLRSLLSSFKLAGG